MTTGGPVRAAIVGAGLMGHWHARAVVSAGSSVSVVVDPDTSRGERLAKAYGARHAATLRDAVNSGGSIDCAHVCTPLEFHEGIAREAIALGLHALVEKPLAATATQTGELLRSAADRGMLLCPVHQFPFQRGVRTIVESLPTIGAVAHVDVVTCSAGADDCDESGRQCIAADIVPHPLSLFAAIVGGPLAAVDWQVFAPEPGEIRVAGAARGATLSFLVSMAGRPTRNALRVIGAHGTAHADLFHGFVVVESGGVSRMRKIVQPVWHGAATSTAAISNLIRRAVTREHAYPGLRPLVAQFHLAVRGAGRPPISPEETLDVAAARDAILARATRPGAHLSSRDEPFTGAPRRDA
jgi:predicted dehydrogenase